jgi:hypothetical protein
MASQNQNDIQGEMVTGWRGPTDRPVLNFSRYLTGAELDVPADIDHMTGVPAWNGATNKLYGTCGPCSYANLIIMAHWFLTGERITVTDQQIFAFYEASGNPNFNPATHQGDNGVDNSVMLAAAQNTGLEVTHADGTTEFIKAVAYGTLTEEDLINQVRAATALFGGVLIGVMLETAQQNQTRATPAIWDYSDSPEWGGHDIFGGSYQNPGGAYDEQVVSWLKLVGMTDQFESNQVQEVFVVILPVMLSNAPILTGVDWQTLADDFQKLTGRPFPVPVPAPPAPPSPAPTPTPAPPTPPTGNEVDADLDLAMHNWQRAKGFRDD